MSLQTYRIRSMTLLVFIAVVLLAACGTTSPGTGSEEMDTASDTDSGEVALSDEAIVETEVTAEMAMSDMDSDTPMGDSDAPYDARFIDSMIVHHQGAVDMANQVIEEGEREELKMLAETMITAQTAEIAQLQQWRDVWYPDLPVTSGMDMPMGAMMISDDISKPIDQRFIEAMIAHHQGAINMARNALEHAENNEIKDLAQTIIRDQEAEIAQMEEWQQMWFE